MSNPTPDSIETMADLRAQIDRIDSALIALLAERQSFTDRAPSLKAKEGLSAAAPTRAAAVLAGVRTKAGAAGFDPDLAEAMWQLMIKTVIAREEREIGTEGRDG